jgi:hypothetical protein
MPVVLPVVSGQQRFSGLMDLQIYFRNDAGFSKLIASTGPFAEPFSDLDGLSFSAFNCASAKVDYP